jgi:hypothetical protein
MSQYIEFFHIYHINFHIKNMTYKLNALKIFVKILYQNHLYNYSKSDLLILPNDTSPLTI